MILNSILALLIFILCSLAISKALKFGPVFSLSVVAVCMVIFYCVAKTFHAVKRNEKNKKDQKSVTVEGYKNTKITKNESTKPQFSFSFLYADWCGYCQKTKPVWKKLSKKHPTINDTTLDYKLLDSDDKKNANFIKKYNVSAYPFIVLEKKQQSTSKSNYVIYKGERKLNDFVQFLKNNIKVMNT